MALDNKVMARIFLLCFAIGIAVTAESPPAYPQSSATGSAQRLYPADRARMAEERERKAQALWEGLTEEDKKSVRIAFESSHDFTLFAPDLLMLRANGRNDEAIKLLAKRYGIEDPRLATIILTLLAYAHDQD